MSSGICLACAQAVDAKGPRLRCGDCGWTLDGETYRRYLDYAKQAVRYGHQYRRYYESSTSNRKPLLPDPSEALVLLALVAVTGIIGNRADAALKWLLTAVMDR